MEHQDSDSTLIKTIGMTVSKIALYICVCVTMGMVISTCKVDENVIIQCEESCGSQGVKEVTSTSCECAVPSDAFSSPFVIPSG